MTEKVSLQAILEKTKDVKPIGENRGIKIVTFEEQRDLAQKEKLENAVISDVVEFNPDGSVAATPTRYAAVNPDHYYINRFRKVGQKYHIVTDYRAITEQASGTIYTTTVPCYIVAEKDGEPVLERLVSISDRDFVADFTHILDHESMQYLMDHHVFDMNSGITTEKLEFKKGEAK